LSALYVFGGAITIAAPNADSMKRGQAVYSRTCMSCHQPTGMGLPPLYPPLAGSEWVSKDASIAVRNIVNGMQGPVTVKGVKYNSMMPPVAGVSDRDIADVVTYVNNSFGNTGPVVTEAEVAAIKKKYADRNKPWNAYELDPDLALGTQAKVEEIKPENAEFLPAIALQAKRGKRVYQNQCTSCHKDDGEGDDYSYPALRGSKIVALGPNVIVPIILNGLQGPLVSKGLLYDGSCPRVGAWSNEAIAIGNLRRLADRTSPNRPPDFSLQKSDIDALNHIEGDIADLVTFIGNSWGNKMKAVTVEDVKAIRRDNSRDKPWTVKELELKK